MTSTAFLSAFIESLVMTDDSQALFDRLGGAETIAEIVQDSYDRILADPDLGPFFAKTSVERLQKMQFQFLASALDGPVEYSGAELTSIHAGRGIRAEHFAKFCGHFADAMEARNVSARDIDDTLARLAIYKDRITGDTNTDG